MHIYEMDDAMLGSEWNPDNGDDSGRFARCLSAAFERLGHAVTIKWSDAYNGGRGLICDGHVTEGDECDHMSREDIEGAYSDALESYSAEE